MPYSLAIWTPKCKGYCFQETIVCNDTGFSSRQVRTELNPEGNLDATVLPVEWNQINGVL